jgi:broad specificity phosphatase PhoE
MRLYIIRHADPDYARDGLTEAGHKEAQALAKRFAAQGLDRIYCSPMGRAMATAKYTADLLGMEYNIEHWTRELWPELAMRGTQWGDIMAQDIPGEILRSGDKMPTHDTWDQWPVIENYQFRDVYEKLRKDSDDFLKRQGYEREGGRYRPVSRNEDQVAVFCHGGFGLVWLAHLLEIPLSLMWSGFWLAPSSVTTILFDERSSDWAVPRCIGLGDVSHLYAAGLPVSRSGIKANFF